MTPHNRFSEDQLRMLPRAATLGALIAERESLDGDFLVIPEDPISNDRATRVSFREFYNLSSACADGMSSSGDTAGRTVILLFDNGLEFCASFFGAVLAGMVPVAHAPPFFAGDLAAWTRTTKRIVRETSARMVIADDTLVPATEGLQCKVVPYSQLPRPHGQQRIGINHDHAAGEANRHEPALIQYSSGSTRSPRGAVLTHENVLTNVQGLGLAIGVRCTDIASCWLPLFHDMGLTGTFIYSLYWGMPLVLMSPRSFVLKPASWLWAISRFRVAGCASPNFGYALCTSNRRVPASQLIGLDLSSWRVALNGAEMIQRDTLMGFEERYRQYGLRENLMMPAYGLAENAVAVCCHPIGVPVRWDVVDRQHLQDQRVALPNRAGRAIASVGKPLLAQQVRVADETGRPLPDRLVGEVQVTGSSVMRGYCNEPEATASAFTSDGWLRTGDLGYMVEGELYIAGRKKDVIKKRGSTHDAADIQAVVGSVTGVRTGCVAAFGLEDPDTGTENVIVVAEVKTPSLSLKELSTLRAQVRSAALAALPASLDIVAFTNPGGLAKGTSGKVRHQECRALYLAGELALLDTPR